MNEPKLRFKADGEIPFPDWEKKDLSDICELITVGIANSATQAYRDTGVIMFRNQNIKENYLDTSDLIYIDPEFEKRYKKKRLKADDLLIVRTGYPGTACLVPPEYEDAQTFTTLIARLIKNENVPAYVCQYINSPLGKSYFESTQIGGGQKNSGAKILENFPISLPSLPEQQKIAFLFTELDTIIQSAEKELEGYRELKQGMLQKMFPKKGEKVPEIRFPEFTGDWEQRKLEDIANRFDNLRVPVASSLRIKGTTPYYGANGIQDYVDGFTHEGEYVLVAEDGANDLINYPVNYVNGRIWVNNHAHVLQGKDNVVNNRYLSYAISRVNMQSVLVGGGRAKLNAEAMMNLDLFLPSIAEQKKIGEYFSNLDNLITLQQKELDGYKELKKGLLQQMFC